jgi:hypothetical protein
LTWSPTATNSSRRFAAPVAVAVAVHDHDHVHVHVHVHEI